jgi:hypothetical protein
MRKKVHEAKVLCSAIPSYAEYSSVMTSTPKHIQTVAKLAILSQRFFATKPEGVNEGVNLSLGAKLLFQKQARNKLIIRK